MTLLRRQHAAAVVALGLSGCGLFLEGPKPDAGRGGPADANLDATMRHADASIDVPTLRDSFARADAPDTQTSDALDALAMSDASTIDAFASDAFANDAFSPDVFAPDAAAPDAFVPVMCIAHPEVCNAIDDDCDGETDEVPLDCRVIGSVMCQRIETPRGRYLLCDGAGSRESARAFCEGVTMFGGTFALVSLETRMEAEALHSAIGTRPESAWIGMVRVPGSSPVLQQFQWDSGAPIVALETSWALGEPNNARSFAPGVEDCVEVFLSRPPTFLAGNWNDVSCAGHPTMFICEESP